MPVFRNQMSNCYALVSYKALYSKFNHSEYWKELGIYPTPRLLAKSIIRDRTASTFMLVRSPHDRVMSCFMDKFRKQPTRIHETGFEWQACHKLMYPYCGITDHMADVLVAEKFLEFTFDNFLASLPKVYKLDGHFQPQSWARQLHIGSNRFFFWPNCKVIRVEDSEALRQIPDMDWSTRTNTTGHIERDFVLSEKNKEVIRTLYRSDFKLGRYSF